MDGKSTSQGNLSIREIEVNELSSVMDLCDLFNQEAASKYYTREHAEEMVHTCLDTPQGVCFGLYTDDKLVGLIIGVVQGHPFNPEEVILFEFAWFVQKEFRGSLSSIKLVKMFEQRGKELGAVTCLMTVRSSLKSVKEVYERLGYHEEEQTYMRIL